MSDEVEVVETESAPVETTESAPEAEAATESSDPAPQREGRPAGYDPVDVKKATPEQIEERINYLYKQVKPKERENREMRQLLAEQSRVIAELSEGQKAVVSHLTERSYTESESQIKEAMATAWQKQDNRAYMDAQARLTKLYADQAVARNQPQQQQSQNVQQPQYRNAAEIANGAVQAGELSTDEYRTTESWQSERDAGGNMLRPWAYSNDPSYTAALFETRSVMANPRYQDWSYEQKLAEVDRRMGVKKPASGQSVMGGSLTKTKKSVTIELSPKQREIALKMKPKGRSEPEQLDWYRKQIQNVQAKRGK